MKLTDNEIRDIMRHLEAGKPLPDAYRFLLFEDKREVELTDFSVFYSQDSIAAAEASIKEKSSKIVVEKGQIVKVTKDAKGVVTRERLTKIWTDWIDYWAVDFNFESKREIIRVPKQERESLAQSRQAAEPEKAGNSLSQRRGDAEEETEVNKNKSTEPSSSVHSEPSSSVHSSSPSSLRLSASARETSSPSSEYEEVWTGDYIFENEWQSFRTKKEPRVNERLPRMHPRTP